MPFAVEANQLPDGPRILHPTPRCEGRAANLRGVFVLNV